MVFPPIEMLQLFAYAGPNIFLPQPAVLLRVRCDKDRSRRLKDALKDGAQFVGMLMAALEVTAVPAGEGFVISAVFATPTPDLGAALAAYVVEGIRALALGDEEWDKDGPLYALQKRRRHEALPVAALQVLATARKRGLPILALPDGRVQIGYGARAWAFAPADASAAAPPWEQLGAIPLYVVTGERGRAEALQRVAAQLRAAGHAVRVQDDADHAATVALLADPTTQLAALSLETGDILRRGLAFDRCTQAVITDMDGPLPTEAADADEWARALGVPMLLASGPAILNQADPRLAALAAYAPHGVMALT